MWKILNQVIGKVNDKSSIPRSLLIDNKSIDDEGEMAHAFNSYFSSIGQNISHNVPTSSKSYDSYLPNHNAQTMFVDPVLPVDVLDVTRKLKPKTSTGEDGISSKLLLKSIDIILHPLTHVVNRSLVEGVFPDGLKCAKIIPVYKACDPAILNNYRPISLLSPFSKILERIMYNKIMKFLACNNLLYAHQYGFRPKHSTIHPILHLLNHCAKVNNSVPTETTLATFCDLSKAFDTISHTILLHKLKVYGIRGVSNNWLESYLSNRTQYVEINSNKSSKMSLTCGVPQGSILGPLLFLIYINDISRSTQANIISFADDTTIFVSDSDTTRLFNRTNVYLNDVFDWFCANKLSLNAKKTKYIIIQPPNKPRNFDTYHLHIQGNILTQVGSNNREQACKFLGIFIDESLSWKSHISHVCSKISRSLFALKQVKSFLPYDSLKTLYYALIQPYLAYGILAWGNASQTSLKRLGVLHKRAMRTIHNKRYNCHTEPLFKQSAILTISDLYEREVLLFMHDFHTGKLPASFRNLFISNRDLNLGYETRQADQLYIPRSISRFVDKLPYIVFPTIWNKWYPSNERVPSRSLCKRSINSFFIGNYSTVVTCENPLCVDCHNV